jgi:hypothetical protein
MLYGARTKMVGLGLALLALGCGSGSAGPTPGANGGSPAVGAGGGSGTGGKSSSGASGGSPSASGGSGGSGGGAGGNSAGTGGAGTGGDSGGGGGSGGSAPADAADETAPTAGNDAAAGPTDSAGPGGPLNFGGVGQVIPVPLQHTATPVGPAVTPECPGDPTQGFTEYEDSFVVQRPRNLAAADRMKYENGIYSFWVMSSDLSHKADSGTAPRTEARYSDMSTGELIWTGDVMFQSPSKTCVFQIHNVNSPIAIYLRVIGNRMFDLSTGNTILTDHTDKWFNLKVAFNPKTLEVRTYINNCLKQTSHAPSSASVGKWYFKHGVYTCDAGTCRSNYKNIHLYQKGSTDTFNTKSTYP